MKNRHSALRYVSAFIALSVIVSLILIGAGGALAETAGTYDITYDPGTAAGSPYTQTLYNSDSDTLAENQFTKTGYSLDSWNTAEDGSGVSYAPGATVSNLGNSYPARYVRICMSGSNLNAGNHLTEVEVFGQDSSENLALGKTGNVITDGVKNDTLKYIDVQNVTTIDLGAVHDVSQVNMWRYWNDSRYYGQTVIALSQNGTFAPGDVCVLYNANSAGNFGFGCGTDGLYYESAAGKSFYISDMGDTYDARYVRVYSYGSTSNTGNHIVELEAYDENNCNIAKGIGGSPMTDASLVNDGGSGFYAWDGSGYAQLDFGEVRSISRLKMYRYWTDGRIYHNTVVVLSRGGSFAPGDMKVLYNSDYNNHFGFGAGGDTQYAETSSGRVFDVDNSIDTVRARYVRVATKGSSSNAGSYYVEIQAVTADRTNVAFGKGGTVLTDGVMNTTDSAAYHYNTNYTAVNIDLGEVYDLAGVNLWRYWLDSRVYYNTVILLSENGTFTGDDLYIVSNADSNNYYGYGAGTAGTYAETAYGKAFPIMDTSDEVTYDAQYVRIYGNASSANTGTHLVELQVIANGLNVAYGKGGANLCDNIWTHTGSSGFYSWDGAGYAQVDLGAAYPVSSLKLWRYWDDARVYRDAVIVLSKNGTFSADDRMVLFNSDSDNSWGYGIGNDFDYAETSSGHEFKVYETQQARYLRVYTQSNTVNEGSHIVEVQAMSPAGTNLAVGKLGNVATDGALNVNSYIDNRTNYIQIDLGSITDVSRINVYRYWVDGRMYHDGIVMISKNGTFSGDDVNVLHNSDNSNNFGFGLGADSIYAETSYGKTVPVRANPSPTANLKNNAVLYAQWRANTYTVVYNGNGATSGAIENTAHSYDTAANLPENTFARTGYSFEGWSRSATGELEFTNNESVVNLTSEDGATVTLYAKWTPIKYYVNYNNDEGTALYTSECTYDVDTPAMTPAQAANITKTGYTLVGWSATQGGAQSIAAGETFKNLSSTYGGMVNLYPVWQANTYTVNYYSADGVTIGATQNCTYEQSYNYLTTEAVSGIAKNGYTCVGWTDSLGGASEYNFGAAFSNLTATANAVISLYPAYTANSYHIVSTPAGCAPGSASYDEGFSVTVPEMTGYVFTGWTVTGLDGSTHYYGASSEDYEASTSEALTPAVSDVWFMNLRATAGTVRFTATWTPIVSTITLDGNGATTQTQTSVTGTFGEPLPTVAVPERLHNVTYDYNSTQADSSGSAEYTFLGYFTAPTGGSKKFNDDGTGMNWVGVEDTTLYAQWTSHSVTLPSPEAVTGHTFGGWYEDEEFTVFAGNAEDIYTPTVTGTLYAKWNVNSYTITLKSDGEVFDTLSVAYGAAIPAFTEPEKLGSTFSGWDVAIPETMPAENLIFNAGWTVNFYTVTFKADGETIGTLTFDYNEAVTAIENPTKTGYTFKAWSPALPATMPAENIEVNATWNLNNYTIKFDTDGGSTVRSITQGYNTVITAPAAPTKTGYTFNSWSPAIPARMPLDGITVKAIWDANEYTISFDTDGGSAVAPITQDFGTAVTAPEAPTKTGYTFVGWSPEIPETMPAGDITLTATWTINQYTITFDTDGGSAVAPITQDFGTAVTAPEAPTKTGYTFAGWDTEIPDTIPSEDITITATWTVNEYTISFDTDGGSAVAPITQNFGTAVTAPEAPTKTGYTFSGWDIEIPETVPAEDITITAIWTVNQYTISFDTDGGSTVAPITQDFASSVTAPEAPTKTGYTFAGWDIEVPSTIPAEDITITATWTVNEYTITFDTDGGSEVAPITQNFGTAVTAPEAPTRTGYTFAGWDIEIPATIPAEDITITAIWTVNEYTISFNTDGGSEVSPIIQNFGTAVTAPEAPTKAGYSFAGWDMEIPSTIPAENITITATWTVNEYTITFDTDGGSAVASITQNFGTAVTAPEAPTKTGYTFAGWDIEIPETIPSEDITVTATWTVNQYTITLDTDGGSAVAPITQNFGTAVTAPEAPTKTGYTFAGWDIEIPSTMLAEDFTITATWTVNEYTITFDTDGGSAVASITQNFGTAVTAPEAPTKTGYTFVGWDIEIPATIPAEDITITAIWSANAHTITFDTDGGSAVAPITQDFGTTVTVPEAPTKTGYTFAGWDIEIPATMPAEDSTITATWTINEYTITFDTDGGTAIAPITQNFGTAVSAPEAPTKTGYTFAGWNIEIPATIPAADITITAIWTVNQYTISFDADGGSEVAPITQNFGTAVTAPQAPTKTGYTFAGWNVEIPENMPANDITITATWTINQYTVTFDTDGGSAVAPITQNYNTALTAPEAPTKDGYDFIGWSSVIPSTMPAEDITITALWTAKTYQLSFDTDGGNEIPAVSYVTDAPITAPADPVKEGYIFLGWTPVIPATMPAEDISVKATWELGQFTITFVTADGTEIPVITNYYGQPITAPENPQREGYIFLGWNMAIPSSIPGENIVITALWEAKTYTVIFKDKDGKQIGEAQTIAYGEAAVFPEDEANYFDKTNHYTFSGWSGGDEITGDTVITPVFTEEAHTYAINVTEPTCTESGSTLFTCTCGYSYTGAFVSANGHSFVRNEAGDIEPTCTETGIKSFICSVCGEHNDIVWKSLNHDFSDEWITETEPNCTETGIARRHCTRCDAITGAKVIPALGHRYGEWEVVIEPTCTETGTDICYCRYCDKTQERTTPVIAHTDEDGDHYCDVCEERFGVCVCGSTVIHDQDNAFEYFLCLFVQIFRAIKSWFSV